MMTTRTALLALALLGLAAFPPLSAAEREPGPLDVAETVQVHHGPTQGNLARLRTSLTPALALARLCVNESGMRAYTRADCAAIHAVVLFRAEHIYRTDYVTALHRYSRGVVRDATHRQRRMWILDLWPDAREPRDYCPVCRWEGRGERWWARTYRHAVDILRGDVEPVACSPHHWAAPSVVHETMERLDCGDTVNVFWSVPRYALRWGPS